MKVMMSQYSGSKPHLARPHDLLSCIDGVSTPSTLLCPSKLLGKFGRVGVGCRSVSLGPGREERKKIRQNGSKVFSKSFILTSLWSKNSVLSFNRL